MISHDDRVAVCYRNFRALSVSLFTVFNVAGSADRQQIVTLRKLPEKVARSGQGDAVSMPFDLATLKSCRLHFGFGFDGGYVKEDASSICSILPSVET